MMWISIITIIFVYCSNLFFIYTFMKDKNYPAVATTFMSSLLLLALLITQIIRLSFQANLTD